MTNKKLRIMWNSNAMYATSGYAQQMAELLPLIRDEGYPIAITNFYGSQGGKFALDGIVNYPVINHVYGSDALVLHAKDFSADVAFSLQDVWPLNPTDLAQVKRWIPWLPIDHDPIPNAITEKLKYAYRVVAMSKFGQRELQRKGIMSTYIPHSVNTNIFKPMDKAQRKKESNLPVDSFVCGMVSANKDNPPRKSFQEVMDAFKMFLEKVPNALLYIHTNPEFPGGFPIREYAGVIGILDKLLFPDNYQMNFNTSKENMAMIYGAMDVLLCPSVSEGFGIPIIESQSCGIPVIVNNFTSMPELVKNHISGEVCDLVPGPNGRRFSGLGSYIGIPSTLSIFDCLMKIYSSDREKMGKEARDYMLQEYATDKVFKEKWVPYLELLEKEVYKD